MRVSVLSKTSSSAMPIMPTTRAAPTAHEMGRQELVEKAGSAPLSAVWVQNRRLNTKRRSPAPLPIQPPLHSPGFPPSLLIVLIWSLALASAAHILDPTPSWNLPPQASLGFWLIHCLGCAARILPQAAHPFPSVPPKPQSKPFEG